MSSHFDVFKDHTIPVRIRVRTYNRRATVPVTMRQLRIYETPEYCFPVRLDADAWNTQTKNLRAEVREWCVTSFSEDHFLMTNTGIFFTTDNDLLMFKLAWHDRLKEYANKFSAW